MSLRFSADCGGCSSVVERLVVVQNVVGSIPISRPIYHLSDDIPKKFKISYKKI